MVSHAETGSKKKNGEKKKKNTKSDPANTDPSEYGHNYSINLLNLG